MNKLDNYDKIKLQEVYKTIEAIYNYNYISSSSLTKKLETILNKIEGILKTGVKDETK